MKVLVIGSGAREHAIAYTLLKGGSVSEVTVAPGNPGMERDGIRTMRISPQNRMELIEFVRDNGYDWVFVGPEVPLVEGIVDDFADAGIKAFGPTRKAAMIEGSKTFAKTLMQAHGIPTAASRTFIDLASAEAYVRGHGAPIVVKADGLAAGKGVTVAMDEETAVDALHEIFVDHRFGAAGLRVVLEDYLEGQEFSLMSFVNGRRFWPMPISQDHKRAYDDDKGPNTGGMGAYSPVPQIGDDVVKTAVDTIVRPTVEAMADGGAPFTGVLYAGLIATDEGPKVIEFNARFGDPETEVVLPLLSSDLGKGIDDILSGREPEFTWDTDHAVVGVVLASDGYPTDAKTGATVPIIETDDDSHVYYAGVKIADTDMTASRDSGMSAAAGEDGESSAETTVRSGSGSSGHIGTVNNITGATSSMLKTVSQASLASSSGRVLLLAAKAESIGGAQTRAYELLNSVDTDGMFYRHDIADKALR